MAIGVVADAPTDGPEPAFTPYETDIGEGFEVDNSDLEEDDAMLECLTEYCFYGKVFLFVYESNYATCIV